jgi:hypothetical protein
MSKSLTLSGEHILQPAVAFYPLLLLDIADLRCDIISRKKEPGELYLSFFRLLRPHKGYTTL